MRFLLLKNSLYPGQTNDAEVLTWRVYASAILQKCNMNHICNIKGLPRWLSSKESACKTCRRHRFNAWAGKIPWGRKWQPTIETSDYGRSPVCSDAPFREDCCVIPEKEMATHCSILAWETPWTEEPSGLWSTGSQRVGHDWVTEHACTHTYNFKRPHRNI